MTADAGEGAASETEATANLEVLLWSLQTDF